MNKYLIIVIFSLIICLAISISTCSRQYNKYKENGNLIHSLNDTLKIFKDNEGFIHNKISIIETEKIKDFLNIKSKDSIIQELQKLVKKYENNIKNQGSITTIKTITKFDTIYHRQTNITNYTDSINNTWIHFFYSIKKDTINFNLSINNKYNVIIGEEKEKWYKKAIPYVDVVNENPYTVIKSLRTYQVSKPKEKRFTIGPQIGLGIGFTNKGFGYGAFIGIGIQYKLIQF